MFDRATLEPLTRFDTAGHDTNRLAFGRDDRLQVAVSGPVLRVYDLRKEVGVACLRVGDPLPRSAALAPDGLTAAVAGATGRVLLFDLDCPPTGRRG